MRHVLFAACLVSIGTSAHAQLTVRSTSTPPGEESVACSPERRACVFTDSSGANVYSVEAGTFKRTEAGQVLYSIPMSGKSVKVLLAAASRSRNQLVMALEMASVATSALFQGGGFSPDAVQRQYWVTVRNPKSGEEIKAIDLGMLKPTGLSMTDTGDYLWVAGDELQLRKREVRMYNTRSGKQEHNTSLEKNANVRLYERGFQVASTYYAADLNQAAGAGRIKHNSPNSFSIAEFTVTRSASLSLAEMKDAVIAVVGFQGATADLREMLEGSLALKLGAAGFKVAERQRLKELLQEVQFQNLGLTEGSKATELGKMLNAQYLLFGQLTTAGTMTSLALRLVGVSDGALKNGIELECRDCQPDDYLQGLTFLMQDWKQ
jgi:hypothetical protein